MELSKSLQKSIHHIRKTLTESDLRKIFTNRLDDEMFETIGKLATPKKKGITKKQFVWFGYELLIGLPEPYCAFPTFSE